MSVSPSESASPSTQPFVLVIIWTRVQLQFNSRVVSKKRQNFTESGGRGKISFFTYYE